MVTLDKDTARALGREITMFVPDLVIMLRRVVADPRVPHSAKVEAAAALAYLASPKNRLTNMIPVVGQLDDVAIVAFAFRRLVVGAGEPILREHWRGSDRGFQVLIGASSALASPAGAVRKAKLARSLVTAGLDRVRGVGSASGGAALDPDRIVDGEVLGRA
ncbi:YkvA family protein, partial [Frankia sp. AgKG'84/4]|uniref:YkvA family protein n=1 Tax=Frankia sp. AgKG'84/4 TaxID=573490 RepID=UPI00202A23BD